MAGTWVLRNGRLAEIGAGGDERGLESGVTDLQGSRLRNGEEANRAGCRDLLDGRISECTNTKQCVCAAVEERLVSQGFGGAYKDEVAFAKIEAIGDSDEGIELSTGARQGNPLAAQVREAVDGRAFVN